MTTSAAVTAYATISADPLGVLVAFGAGMLSFLSPCVLPLVPGYVSMVSGLSAAEIEDGAARDMAPLVRGGLGHLLLGRQRGLDVAAGALVVAFGVCMVGFGMPNRLLRERRFHPLPS